MAKFTFIVPPLTGHVNPTLSLGNELLKRNHTVSWMSLDPGLKDQLPPKGELITLPIFLEEEKKNKLMAQAQELQKRSVYGIDSLKFLYEEVLTPMNAIMFDGINHMLEHHDPDVIISDHQIFAGAVASIRKNIPYATSITAPASIKINPSFPKIYEWEGEQVIAFQKQHGISENKRFDCSSQLSLVYTSQQFFGETKLSPNYKFIGPLLTSRSQNATFDWERFNSIGKNRAKILVSIGTNFDHTQKKTFFDKVVEAFEKENIAVVVVSDPNLFDYIPDNFIIQRQIPQLDIIPHLQAVVCHGGNNTVCETLSYGIPLVVIPIAYDQSYVSGCVTDQAVGIRLNFNRFKSRNLKEAVNSILTDNSYDKNAKMIQDSFQKAGGVVQGVNYLETLVKH